MTDELTPDWLVPDDLAPAIEGSLAPLYTAAARHSLVMPFCERCDRTLELEQLVCETCGGGPSWREVEPVGTVHSATTVERWERSLLKAEKPYHLLDVEVRSGHRVIMTTDRPVDESPSLGSEVRIGFRTVGDVNLPAAIVSPRRTHQPEVTHDRGSSASAS